VPLITNPHPSPRRAWAVAATIPSERMFVQREVRETSNFSEVLSSSREAVRRRRMTRRGPAHLYGLRERAPISYAAARRSSLGIWRSSGTSIKYRVRAEAVLPARRVCIPAHQHGAELGRWCISVIR